ncbi:MAG: hypothetical protein H2174_03380 [Vampirovibrio sp.]|nr:hypothetical protein [Vampirovibrio sp.]
MSITNKLSSTIKRSFHQRCHKGNALIITISILLLATAQMLFMGLITSSTTTDEGLLAGQNAEVKDALNLGFIDIENRINMALNNGATPAQISDDFQLPWVGVQGRCVPSFRRDSTNLATILPSSAINCPFERVGDVPFNTLMDSRLAIEAVRPGATATDPMVVAVQPPLDRYTDISVYLARPPQGKSYTFEARAIGRGVNITIQKQVLFN